MPTIDMRRRKSPVTLPAIYKRQQYWFARSGEYPEHVLLREDQLNDLCGSLDREAERARERARELGIKEDLAWTEGLRNGMEVFGIRVEVR